MERKTFDELWAHHENIRTYSPPRTVEWVQQKAIEEAQEFAETHPDNNMDHFLEEGADLFITWMGTMKEAGVSMEVALQAIWMKMNTVIDRMIDTETISKERGIPWEEAYGVRKAQEMKEGTEYDLL